MDWAAHTSGFAPEPQPRSPGGLEGAEGVIPVPSGVRVWIATGHTDMRSGMKGLALQVQEA